MKTVITIENGRIEIKVDDAQPVLVQATTQEKPVTSAVEHARESSPHKLQGSNKPNGLDSVKQTKSSPPRNCEICGNSIPPTAHRLVKVCSDDCRKKKQREHSAKNYQKRSAGSNPNRSKEGDPGQFGLPDSDKEPALTQDAPPPKTYTRSKCCEAKVEITGAGQVGAPHSICLACMKVCDTYEYTPPFTDDWNCNACRLVKRLCRLHAKLEEQGKTAPRFV